MTSIYCSQGHPSLAGNRFCQQCGEPLNPLAAGPYQGLLLGERYRVSRELGHGGFGRTYLAEDTNRFNEPCVLKEFAPQVAGTYALQKAEELFAREAGVLYKLQHPQIPRFRELFRANLGGQGRLFLVQDYVEGPTYDALLQARRQQGYGFNEMEIIQLLHQVLPVLAYIHSVGVIHRDISPDNLIQRNIDGLPVLIDFGGVKQVAATIASQMQSSATNAPTLTRLGKVGYAPEEQMRSGIAAPPSDLYALAVTVLVLLTGREPQDLQDPQTLAWNWQPWVRLSPVLEGVLGRMLATRPGDRYPSAQAVLQALDGGPDSLPPQVVPSFVPTHPTATQAVQPGNDDLNPEPIAPRPSTSPARTLATLALMAGLTIAGWWAGTRWLAPLLRPAPRPTNPVVTQPTPKPTEPYSAEEQTRKQQLSDRRSNLGLDYKFYISLVNQLFYQKYPEQKGRTLGQGPEDATARAQWDQVASSLMDRLEALSPEARSNLGRYSATDRDRWKAIASQLNLSRRALYELADGVFFHLFPEQPPQNLLDQPIGQVWQGIVADQLQAAESGKTLEKLAFDPDRLTQQVRGSLATGAGKVYLLRLQKGQDIRLRLQADSGSARLSFYPPTSKAAALLQASRQTEWAGKLTRSGYYEIVVIAAGNDPVTYQLEIRTPKLDAANSDAANSDATNSGSFSPPPP